MRNQVPANGEAMPASKAKATIAPRSKQYAIQVLRWIEAKILRCCTALVVPAPWSRNHCGPTESDKKEHDVVGIAFNKADDSEELSDEARLAQSFARMQAAIGDDGAATDVQSLIAAHKDAYRAFLPLCDEHEAADDALRAKLKGMLYRGPFTTSYEMGYGRDWVFEQVSNEIERHRGHLRILEKLDPTAHEAALRALDEVEERQEPEIDAAFAVETATYDEVDARYVTGSDRERNALLAICSHRCSTPEQYQLKGDYLASFGVRDGLDVDHIDALIDSIKTAGMALPKNNLDPLFDLIEAYRAGMREYAGLPDTVTRKEEDDAYDKFVGPHSYALKNWTRAATTTQGAIEALKFMIEEDMFNDMAGKPLARAVISFLQKSDAQHITGTGRYTPLVPTGRGSWLSYKETSLDELLAKFDRAYPEYTDGSREDVIANWKLAEDEMNDVELRRLAQELKAAWEFEQQLSSTDADGEASEAAYEVCNKIVGRIREIQAHTLEGLKAKALAVFWCHSGELIDFEEKTTDLQLAADLINDLLAA